MMRTGLRKPYHCPHCGRNWKYLAAVRRCCAGRVYVTAKERTQRKLRRQLELRRGM